MRQVFHRHAQGEIIGLGHRFEDAVVPREPRRCFAPGPDSAFGKRKSTVGNHQLGIDFELGAQPGTIRAGTVRRVERKIARVDFRQGDVAIRAGEFLR